MLNKGTAFLKKQYSELAEFKRLQRTHCSAMEILQSFRNLNHTKSELQNH